MQTIYLDISNKGVIPAIYAKQGDVGRKFEVVLTDSGLPYVPASGSAFSVWYSGASGEGNYTDIGDKSAFSVNGNKVTVEMIAQMLSNDGDGVLSLVLNDPNANQISTWNIPYICESVPGADSEEAKDYYTAFSKAVENLPYPDTSLSVAGKAADAAAVGAALSGKAPALDWSHLKWYVMGDSLTARDNAFTDKRYYDFVQEKTGIQVIVDGIGGTGYGAGASNGESYYDRVQNIPDDVDIVTIFGSGNDIRYANGANEEIWNTLNWLALNRPGLRVIVVPPSPWLGYNKREDPWKAYCDRLQVCAFTCNFRYVSDMYDCPPFNPNFTGHMELFFTTDPEGIHPDENGHKALAPYFYNALLEELALDKGVVVSPGGSGGSGGSGGAVDIPTALPNPHKLTFTGAVTAEYDGSKEVTVDIPQGGNGGGIEVTGASVGQTIVVKAVDDNGNPTEWETRDFPDFGGNAAKSGSSAEYKWIPRGLMRDQIKTFQGWTHCVRYDERLGKAVGIVMAGEAAHTNEQPWYRVTIDDNGYMSDYEEIIVYNSDGETVYTPNNGYVCGFCILSDGSYLIQDNDWNTDDAPNFYKSTDHGKTFTRLDIEGFPSQAFGLRQLSTGRIISGCAGGKNRFYYSDNGGETWSESNVLDVSTLGNPPFENDTTYEFSEHCIIEFSSGTLLAIGRTSNNARDMYGTIRGDLQGAAIAYSDDHGETWRDFGWSKTITNMTSNNAACVCIDGIYHLVMGDRYTYTTDNEGNRRYFAMYYQYATEEDALNDKWSDPVVIDYGHWTSDATTPTDSGYPSLWKDAANNLHCVFYDGDGSGHAYGANWRLIDGNPYAQGNHVTDDGSGSLALSYSQKQVETMLAEQKASIMNVMMAYITELYELTGNLVPDSGENDGSNYITSNLLLYFNLVDTSLWSDDSKYIYPVHSASDISRLANSTTSAFSIHSDYATVTATNCVHFLTDSSAQKTLAEMGVDSADGFTLEFGGFVREENANYSNTFLYGLTATDATLRWMGPLTVPVITDGALTNVDSGASITFTTGDIHHFVYVFTPTDIEVYYKGVMVGEPVAISEEQYEAAKALYVRTANQNTAYKTAIRLYNAPLTADQCMNNYIWFKNFVDNYGTESTE